MRNVDDSSRRPHCTAGIRPAVSGLYSDVENRESHHIRIPGYRLSWSREPYGTPRSILDHTGVREDKVRSRVLDFNAHSFSARCFMARRPRRPSTGDLLACIPTPPQKFPETTTTLLRSVSPYLSQHVKSLVARAQTTGSPEPFNSIHPSPHLTTSPSMPSLSSQSAPQHLAASPMTQSPLKTAPTESQTPTYISSPPRIPSHFPPSIRSSLPRPLRCPL